MVHRIHKSGWNRPQHTLPNICTFHSWDGIEYSVNKDYKGPGSTNNLYPMDFNDATHRPTEIRDDVLSRVHNGQSIPSKGIL